MGTPPLPAARTLYCPLSCTGRKERRSKINHESSNHISNRLGPCLSTINITKMACAVTAVHLSDISFTDRSSRSSSSLAAVVRRCVASVHYRSNPGKHVLDHADYTAPIRQHELNHTDQEAISPQGSRSSSGNGLNDLYDQSGVCKIMVPVAQRGLVDYPRH